MAGPKNPTGKKKGSFLNVRITDELKERITSSQLESDSSESSFGDYVLVLVKKGLRLDAEEKRARGVITKSAAQGDRAAG